MYSAKDIYDGLTVAQRQDALLQILRAIEQGRAEQLREAIAQTERMALRIDA